MTDGASHPEPNPPSSDLQSPLGFRQGFVQFVDRLNEALGLSISWLTMLMVAVTFLVVVLRYVFDLGWIAMQESVTYMHAAVFMVGAAFTLKHQGHVRVDILYRKFGERGRAWVNLLGGLLLLLPAMLFIAWISWEYVLTSWDVLEGSREAGGLPGVFVLKTLILIMPLLLVLQVLAGILRDWLLIRSSSASSPGAESS